MPVLTEDPSYPSSATVFLCLVYGPSYMISCCSGGHFYHGFSPRWSGNHCVWWQHIEDIVLILLCISILLGFMWGITPEQHDRNPQNKSTVEQLLSFLIYYYCDTLHIVLISLSIQYILLYSIWEGSNTILFNTIALSSHVWVLCFFLLIFLCLYTFSPLVYDWLTNIHPSCFLAIVFYFILSLSPPSSFLSLTSGVLKRTAKSFHPLRIFQERFIY